MDRREYEKWKAAEADYRKQRRKRKGKTPTRKEAGYLWDQTNPIIRFEQLIPRWQSSVVAFLTAVRQGRELAEAWYEAKGTIRMGWLDLDAEFRRSLTEMADHGT